MCRHIPRDVIFRISQLYERLIRSIKLAMHKSLGKTTPPREELGTLLIEIESMLNTRPLLYDHEYFNPAEQVASQTKAQVLQAIKSSYKLTEKFWQQWQSEYLTSLREKHQREVGNKRGSRIAPKQGQVVLVCDALQPRYMWKMGSIEDLVSNQEGVVGEASVLLPSHRKIRRPINLLVPLELDDGDSTSEPNTSTPRQSQEGLSESSKTPEVTEDDVVGGPGVESKTSRYNLRQLKKIDYKKLSHDINIMSVFSITLISTVIGICTGSRIKESAYLEWEVEHIHKFQAIKPSHTAFYSI
ncbi:unnamed protein product [Heligmosomoides polygyrus]|uniref:DUF5641 domain-containing protein n=1 Tax=Heligmosomoides polygyrus TaxID=6339 RepID=A0A183GDR0_HELPZ|nr:unnamed protein product [Heligmosomoides polygyrus]